MANHINWYFVITIGLGIAAVAKALFFDNDNKHVEPLDSYDDSFLGSKQSLDSKDDEAEKFWNSEDIL